MRKLVTMLLLTIITLLGLWSCKKSFFDAASVDGSITDASAFKTKPDYEKALIGAYASLSEGNVGGDLWVAVPGWISQDWVDNTLKPKPIENYMNTGASQFLDYWTGLYKIVGSANLEIDKVATAPEGILTDNEKSSLSAQAKFLRGWAYFMLARAYGDVPMPLNAYTAEQNSLSCTPNADVFKQVVKDLTEAAAVLPELNDWSADDRGRATKGAALAYLANAQMYLKDWTNADKASTDLFALNKPKYELAADIHAPFSVLKKNDDDYKKENIFEVQYREKAGDNFYWGDVPNGGQLLAGSTSPRDVGNDWASWGGWGEDMINKKLVDAYDTADKRRKQLVKLRGESYKGELMATTMGPNDWGTNAAAQKDVGYSTKYWLGNDGGTLAPQNLPMMRFAEVLLNYAEILFMESKPTEAYAALNQVRARANVPALLVSATPAVFMADLMRERRFELIFEPNLWFHYTRTETAAAFLQTVYGITWQKKWSHFPIPDRERSVNPNLCSNGY
ncbi:MAG: RagB/SusD family nutrient uptake outer membrane protein [Bacteroidota bacterium]